jgi:hypothetical protein
MKPCRRLVVRRGPPGQSAFLSLKPGGPAHMGSGCPPPPLLVINARLFACPPPPMDVVNPCGVLVWSHTTSVLDVVWRGRPDCARRARPLPIINGLLWQLSSSPPSLVDVPRGFCRGNHYNLIQSRHPPSTWWHPSFLSMFYDLYYIIFSLHVHTYYGVATSPPSLSPPLALSISQQFVLVF